MSSSTASSGRGNRPRLDTSGVVATTGAGGDHDHTEHVIVAVRVRPFNQRELKRKAQLIVNLEWNETNDGKEQHTLVVRHPEEISNVKKFIFDRVYWSHDGFIEAPGGLLVADQRHMHGKIYVDQVSFHGNLF